MKLLWIYILLFVTTSSFAQEESDDLVNTIIHVDELYNDAIIANFFLDIEDTIGLSETFERYKLVDNCKVKRIRFQSEAIWLDKESFKSLQYLCDKINSQCSSFFTDSDGLIEQGCSVYFLIWKIYGKDFCVFSRPVYSEDKKFALIKYNVLSGTIYGNSSMTYLFENVAGQWVKKETVAFEHD